jgi:hypothetical protein
VVTTCGSIAPFGAQPAGGLAYPTMNVNGSVCTNATSGGGGGVTGPGTSTIGNLAAYGSTTGPSQSLLDSGISAASLQPFQGFIANDTMYYPAWPGATVTASGSNPLQNFARCSPFYWPIAAHVDQAGMNVSTLGLGPINFALYTDAIDATTHKHQPQALITNPNVTFTVTSVAAVTVALGSAGTGVALAQGLNWVCINDTASADGVRWMGLASTTTVVPGLIGTSTLANAVGATQLVALIVAQTAGTTAANWPSFAGVAFSENVISGNTPAFAFRVATQP